MLFLSLLLTLPVPAPPHRSVLSNYQIQRQISIAKESPETNFFKTHHPPTISQSPGESKYSSGALISLSLSCTADDAQQVSRNDS
jgi:hypothetical protein